MDFAMSTNELDSLNRRNTTPEEMASLLENAARWTRDFEWEELVFLTRHLALYDAPAGTTIFPQGSAGRFLSLITSGQVDIVKEGDGNTHKTLATLPPGRLMGELAMIDGQPRSGSAIATQDTTLLVLTRDKATQLADKDPRLSLRLSLCIARTISGRLRQSSGKLVDLL